MLQRDCNAPDAVLVNSEVVMLSRNSEVRSVSKKRIPKPKEQAEIEIRRSGRTVKRIEVDKSKRGISNEPDDRPVDEDEQSEQLLRHEEHGNP